MFISRVPRPTTLERRASFIGFVVTGLATVGHVTESLASGDFNWSRPVAPAAITALFAMGHFSDRAVVLPVAVVALISSAVAGTFIPENRIAIYISYVIFAAVFATFARTWATRLNFGVTVLAVVTPLLWGAGPAVMVVSGVGAGITGYLVAQMRRDVERARERSEAVLDLAPVIIMEQDWSPVADALADMRHRGVTDLAALLDESPALVSELVELAEPRFANRAALKKYRAPDQASYLARYKSADRREPLVNELSLEGYRKFLLSMWDQDIERTIEMASYDFDGAPWWAKVQWAEHPDGNGLAIVAAADITELKQAQAELEEVNRSKDRFVASISHELRTPLAAVVGFSSELAEHGEILGAEETTQILSIIRDEAQEAAHLIEDLLVAARADMGRVTVSHEPVDLVAAVDSVQRSLHVDVPLRMSGESAVACGDAIRIRQIVRNLLTNSHRYGGPHKELRIEASDHNVVLEVCDDGTSLSESDLERIFEPYTTAHERLGLTDSIGLGLAVARVLCELMNGSLSGGRTDDGTIFRLVLPVPGHCPDGRGVAVTGQLRV